jgi:hypothetical protein
LDGLGNYDKPPCSPSVAEVRMGKVFDNIEKGLRG